MGKLYLTTNTNSVNQTIVYGMLKVLYMELYWKESLAAKSTLRIYPVTGMSLEEWTVDNG